MTARGRIEKLRTDKVHTVPVALVAPFLTLTRSRHVDHVVVAKFDARWAIELPAELKKAQSPPIDRDHPVAIASLEPHALLADELPDYSASFTLDLPPPDEAQGILAADLPLQPMPNGDPVLDLSDVDPLSSLSCFSLPRSLVDRPHSSPFSIFSTAGNQWLAEALGDEFLNWDVLLPSPFGSELTDADVHCAPLRRQFIPLPPKDEARYLLNLYFQSVNPFCPTFEEHDFMLHFENEYPIRPEPSAEKWACLNSALAVACLLDPSRCPKGWLYWKNATMSWGAFFAHAPNLPSAQALITMTMYLVGTFQSNLCNTLVPMAIRTFQGLSPADVSMSRQAHVVLMITRSLDIDHALQAGISPTGLGLDYVHDHTHPAEIGAPSHHLLDFFDAFCELIRLKEDVYRSLYSLSAKDKSGTEVISRVGQLDARLEEWKDSIPQEYRPGHPDAARSIKQGSSALVIHLHLAYHNCLLTIHRRAIPCTTWSMCQDPILSPDSAIRSPNGRTLVSEKLCGEAARASLKLVKHIPQDNPLICGVMVYYLVFALKLFVILIVKDPRSPRTRADIALLRNMEDFLSAISESRRDQSILKLIKHCIQYRNIAEKALQQVLLDTKHANGGQTGKRS
ncbi:fungal specific transcription factor domain-containing protein [Aspergillus undulatus]|uniref:fungal specific transcription factor domain-containing protein n=1 Tax=Aspergillus undulatus TaxID=1810928 RepID=UPI003CCD65C1